MRHHRVFYRVQKTFLTAAVSQAVIARVFRKYPWIRKILEEPGGGPTGEIGAIARRVTLRPLPIAVVIVLRLGQPRVKLSSG